MVKKFSADFGSALISRTRAKETCAKCSCVQCPHRWVTHEAAVAEGRGSPGKSQSSLRTHSALNPRSTISSLFQLSCFALCVSQCMEVLVLQSTVPALESSRENPESLTPAMARLHHGIQWTTLLV